MVDERQHKTACWPDRIIGPRVTLERMIPTSENAQLFLDAIQNNVIHLKDSFDFLVHSITTLKEAEEYLQDAQRETDLNRRDNYGIFFEDTFIGAVCVWGNRQAEREVLYWLIEEACGHRFMDETLGLIEQEHAKTAPQRGLFAIVNDKARASALLLTRRGYVYEGGSFWKIPKSLHHPSVVIKSSFKIMKKWRHTYG